MADKDEEMPGADVVAEVPTKRQAAEAWKADVRNPNNRLDSTGGTLY
jgi:hypothetical protein